MNFQDVKDFLFIVFVSGLTILILLVFLIVPLSLLERASCNQKAEVQQVEVEYRFPAGCIYVDPDYVVVP